MTQLVRWDPFGDFGSLRRHMESLFEDFPARPLRFADAELGFPVDVSETDGAITVKAVLPGIKPEDVEITVSDGILTVRGESREEKKEEAENFYRREIRYGSFSRSVPLPAHVKEDEADATFTDGILTVTLPKAEDAKAKTIKVRSAGKAA